MEPPVLFHYDISGPVCIAGADCIAAGKTENFEIISKEPVIESCNPVLFGQMRKNSLRKWGKNGTIN